MQRDHCACPAKGPQAGAMVGEYVELRIVVGGVYE